MKSLFDLWTQYRTRVIPREAPPTQVEECRRAFYAGAASMYGLVVVDAVEPEDEAACCANLTALDAELEAFTKDLRG